MAADWGGMPARADSRRVCIQRNTASNWPSGRLRQRYIVRAYSAAMSTASASCSCSELSRSEEHTSELQSLMRISYAVFCLKKKTETHHTIHTTITNHLLSVV